MIVYTITENVTVGADAHIGPVVQRPNSPETNVKSERFTARGDVGIAPYGSCTRVEPGEGNTVGQSETCRPELPAGATR